MFKLVVILVLLAFAVLVFATAAFVAVLVLERLDRMRVSRAGRDLFMRLKRKEAAA